MFLQRLEAFDQGGVIPKEVYERFRRPEGARAYHRFYGTATKQQLHYLKCNLRKVFDVGIPVRAGTDTGVTGVLLGVSSQMVLVLLVEDGQTPAEALRPDALFWRLMCSARG